MSATPTNDLRHVELVAEHEVVLTSSAAAVLARMVRQHLDQQHETDGRSVERHTSAAHCEP
jgi:hypothetical protein